MSQEYYTRMLKRQIRRSFGNEGPPVELLPFLDKVNESYEYYEKDRELLERSMDISSKEMEMVNAQLRETNQALDDFNHGVSHDLKSHAINVISLASMLRKYNERDDKKMVETIIDRIETSSDQFLKVINGFLQISKLEHRLGSTSEVVNIQTLVKEVWKEFAENAEATQAQIHLPESVSIRIPKDQLMSIFRNFMSNALKYKKENTPPVIRVTAENTGDEVRIRFSDNGQGIDMKRNKGRIFKMFDRLGKTEEEGTGVGLFLVQRLVHKNLGTIDVESVLGEGTTFILRFKIK